MRSNRVYAPLCDVVGCTSYRLSGRELPVGTQFQFVEKEYMQADEYELLIEDPTGFMLQTFLPRILSELAEPGSKRAQVALIKGGMAFVHQQEVMRNRSMVLQQECGMPQASMGFFSAPFDFIADALRGLTPTMMDMFRNGDKLKAACEVLVDHMVYFGLATADPLKRYPIFLPTHKAMFLFPAQLEEYYWPTLKKVLQRLIEAGYKVRAYLEGDWGHHWKHLLELPKGSVLCDIDDQGDIFKALDELGHHQCIAGGMPNSQLQLGTPDQVRQRVKELCQAAGKDKALIINGGCNIPYDTKPENYRAMLEAIQEFASYDSSLKPQPVAQAGPCSRKSPMLTPWEQKLGELGGVQGDPDLIKEPWGRLESLAHVWVWQWV